MPAKPGQHQGRRAVKYLPSVIALLLMTVIGAVSYYQYTAHPGSSVQQAADPPARIAVAEAKPAKQSKASELILGKQTQAHQSRLRIITHIVVKGDTLWDIAEKYVKNPFRYPELAELNKIKNPDLIYPNDLVRIHIYE